jgi:hypothetical protein
MGTARITLFPLLTLNFFFSFDAMSDQIIKQIGMNMAEISIGYG